jgi:hypothetical protein
MSIAKHLIPIFLALLAGCNSPTKIQQESTDFVDIEVFESDNTTNMTGHIELFLDDFDCFGYDKSLGVPVGAAGISRRIAVSGRKFLTFNVGFMGTKPGFISQVCGTMFSFPVSPGGRYRIKIEANESVCRATVAEKSGRDLIHQETIRRERVVPFFDGTGPWCKSDARFANSSSLLQPRGK